MESLDGLNTSAELAPALPVRPSSVRRGCRPQFEWNEANEKHLLERHDVSALEAEQCFANPHDARRDGLDLVLLGTTDVGRRLHIRYQQKQAGLVRVFHARDMNSRELRIYTRRCLR